MNTRLVKSSKLLSIVLHTVFSFIRLDCFSRRVYTVSTNVKPVLPANTDFVMNQIYKVRMGQFYLRLPDLSSGIATYNIFLRFERAQNENTACFV